MSWVEDLGRARVNLAIVVLGAATIIGLIKLTSLLPEKYYFRFSVLVSSQSSPFIVQPPGVTYAKLCALIRSNQLERRTSSVNLDCSQEQTTGPSYGTENADAIYRVAYAIDEEVRALFERSAAIYAPQALPDEELQQAIEYASNIGAGVENIENRYRVQVTEAFEELFRNHFTSRFESLPETDEPQAGSEESEFGITEAGRQLLRDAHLRVASQITRPLTNIKLSPMTKAELDELTKWVSSRDAVIGAVASYYTKQVAEAYGDVLRSGFAHAGIDQAGDRQRLDRAVMDAGLSDYLTSALIRILPVLLFGLAVGLIFGPKEINSAAVAAALAAFLLAWPVVLMWDQVVSYDWQDKRELFSAFYIVYVLSFFLTARVGAGLGASIRKSFWASAEDAVGPVAVFRSGTALKVARDLVLALAVNTAFYVGNALVVLVA